MWNTSELNGDGGFDTVNDTNGGDGGETSKDTEEARRIQNIVPVFISYITECPDDEFTIYGMTVQMVSVVGVVRNFEVQSTKATCTVEDQSGSIQAILWLETHGEKKLTAVPAVKENCYVQVFGSIRTQARVKMIMILKIIPVDDLNVITHHQLQCLHAREYDANSANETLPTQNQTTNEEEGSMSYSDIKEDAPIPTAAENPHGLRPIQFKIMSLVKAATHPMGMTKEQILRHFTSGEARDVCDTLKFLLDEGHAYTTCDNNHYQATDGF